MWDTKGPSFKAEVQSDREVSNPITISQSVKSVWCVSLSLGWNGERVKGSSLFKMSVWQERCATLVGSCLH